MTKCAESEWMLEAILVDIIAIIVLFLSLRILKYINFKLLILKVCCSFSTGVSWTPTNDSL